MNRSSNNNDAEEEEGQEEDEKNQEGVVVSKKDYGPTDRRTDGRKPPLTEMQLLNVPLKLDIWSRPPEVIHDTLF